MSEVKSGTTRRKLDAVDIAKFIGSLLILAMHCEALSDYHENAGLALTIITRWTVPFFFISSAYFLFRKGVNGRIDKKQLTRYISRIGMLYLCWFIYNLPSIYYERLYQENLSDLKTWFEFIKFSLFSATFFGSWYLTSSIFSAWLMYMLSRRFKTTTMIGMTSVVYILVVLTSVYKGILPEKLTDILLFFCFPLNLLTGCFYFAIGKYIAENETKITDVLSGKKAALLFIVFYLIYAAEVILSKHSGVFGSSDAAFSTAPLACALFILCLQSKIQCAKSVLYRKLSIIIYCCQGNVLILNSFFRKVLKSSVAACVLSVVVALAISFAVLYIQKHKDWKWAGYLA